MNLLLKQLFCYVLLCIVVLMPQAGQTASMAMQTSQQSQSVHASMTDCMMDNQHAATQNVGEVTYNCCQDNASGHATCADTPCEQTGCQCEHSSSQFNVYLPEVNSTSTAPRQNQLIPSAQTIAIIGHNTLLFRPPISSVI